MSYPTQNPIPNTPKVFCSTCAHLWGVGSRSEQCVATRKPGDSYLYPLGRSTGLIKPSTRNRHNDCKYYKPRLEEPLTTHNDKNADWIISGIALAIFLIGVLVGEIIMKGV